MTALVISEHNNNELKPVTLNTISAKALDEEVHVLVAGKDCASVAEASSKIEGVTKVLLDRFRRI